ncbi:MAG: hypothetical protein V4717_15400 [Bacteroidota bacterium]
MLKLYFVSLQLLTTISLYAQNVGIGTTAPTGPLSFSNTIGKKIVFWGDGNAAHYGIGIQGGLMQVYSDAPLADIAFGFGQSAAFNQRMRIINYGADGLQLKGRITLKNGTDPLDVNNGAGVWLFKADNSALLSFMGTQNNKNVGFYGGPAGWGFTYDAINSRVGIGNNNPATLLDIASGNNWDLANTEGDVRIGNSTYRLKIGLAIGGGGAGATTIMQYGANGGFNNLALGSQGKNFININGTGNYIDLTNLSGGLRLTGNAGTTGQVLQSNGLAAPTWVSQPGILTQESTGSSLVLTGSGFHNLTNSTLVLNLSRAAKVLLFMRVAINKNPCFLASCASKARVVMYLNGNAVNSETINAMNFSSETIQSFSTESYGPEILELAAGIHNITFTAINVFNEPQLSFSAKAIIFEK